MSESNKRRKTNHPSSSGGNQHSEQQALTLAVANSTANAEQQQSSALLEDFSAKEVGQVAQLLENLPPDKLDKVAQLLQNPSAKQVVQMTQNMLGDTTETSGAPPKVAIKSILRVIAVGPKAKILAKNQEYALLLLEQWPALMHERFYHRDVITLFLNGMKEDVNENEDVVRELCRLKKSVSNACPHFPGFWKVLAAAIDSRVSGSAIEILVSEFPDSFDSENLINLFMRKDGKAQSTSTIRNLCRLYKTIPDRRSGPTVGQDESSRDLLLKTYRSNVSIDVFKVLVEEFPGQLEQICKSGGNPRLRLLFSTKGGSCSEKDAINVLELLKLEKEEEFSSDDDELEDEIEFDVSDLNIRATKGLRFLIPILKELTFHCKFDDEDEYHGYRVAEVSYKVVKSIWRAVKDTASACIEKMELPLLPRLLTEDFDLLAAALNRIPNLKSLALCECKDGRFDMDADALLELCCHLTTDYPNIEALELSFDDGSLPVEGLKALCTCSRPGFKELSFYGCRFWTSSHEHLEKELPWEIPLDCRLETVNYVGMGLDSEKLFLSGLAAVGSLRDLSFRVSQLYDFCFQDWFSVNFTKEIIAILEMNTLRSLTVHDYYISPKKLAKALETNTSLKHLSLFGRRGRCEGCEKGNICSHPWDLSWKEEFGDGGNYDDWCVIIGEMMTHVLRHHNFTLERFNSNFEYNRTELWTLLNRNGRNQVHAGSAALKDIVGFLGGIAAEDYLAVDLVCSAHFELLGLSPALWSRQ